MTDLPPVLGAKQAAALLQCHPETAEELARDGKVPAVKVGRPWLFPTEAMLQFLNQRAMANLKPEIRQQEQSEGVAHDHGHAPPPPPSVPARSRNGRQRFQPPPLPVGALPS